MVTTLPEREPNAQATLQDFPDGATLVEGLRYTPSETFKERLKQSGLPYLESGARVWIPGVFEDTCEEATVVCCFEGRDKQPYCLLENERSHYFARPLVALALEQDGNDLWSTAIHNEQFAELFLGDVLRDLEDLS